MKTQLENVPMAREHMRIVDRIATEVLNIEDDDTTRSDVAKIVREHGFGAHIGGHHVAIHHTDTTGAIRGARLAIVTHNGKDWV